MNDALTFRQERFALEYLKDQNASAAAARAGYKAKNMAAQGHELLNNPAIRERVRVEMAALLAEIRCSVVDLMKQRVKAAYFDTRKLFREDWTVRTPEELDEEARAVVEVTTVIRKSGPVVRMKQMDRDRALRALERVNERMDRLNEAYYETLRKAGMEPTLEEIEGMDAEEALNAGEVPAIEDAERHRVLSGSAGGADVPAVQNSVKTMVLSGSAPTVAKLDLCRRGTRPSTGSGRTVGGCGVSGKIGTSSRPPRSASVREMPADIFTEKPRVLSGGPARLSRLAAAVHETMGFALAA